MRCRSSLLPLAGLAGLALGACDPVALRGLDPRPRPGVDAGDAPAPDPGRPGAVRFEIDATGPGRPISPLIYGVPRADALGPNRATVTLTGGRAATYNWEINAHNAGADDCHANVASGPSDAPGEEIRAGVAAAAAAGATTLVALPILPRVAADRLGSSPAPVCSGDVRKSADYLTTRFRRNALRAPAARAGLEPDLRDDAVYQDELVRWLRARVPGARLVFALGHWPEFWHQYEAVVHPQRTGYDELVGLNVDLARVVKEAAPDAAVAGLGSLGWPGLMNLGNPDDEKLHGGFLEHYLSRMRQAEAEAGRRLVDLIEIHWFPVKEGREIAGDATDEATVTARLQAPRSLWDLTFDEGSWITRVSTAGPLRLLPRLRAAIDAHYPGTKLAFTNWVYGAGHDVSGAIAIADVLGIFGREGVELANQGDDRPFALAALRCFRNFDGAGGAFGDLSLPASTSHVAGTSVYASASTTVADRLVVVALNKTTGALETDLVLRAPRPLRARAAYRLTAAAATPVPVPVPGAAPAHVLPLTLPGRSISVVVLGR